MYVEDIDGRGIRGYSSGRDVLGGLEVCRGDIGGRGVLGVQWWQICDRRYRGVGGDIGDKCVLGATQMCVEGIDCRAMQGTAEAEMC